ncbi:MAG TPA: prolyl oligopeptidase family serine peptidase [Gemmata sp.]|jgi:predicted peptidase|nr:prolyl oligopeptidase family serine peptidase [Gemmata sp.]
MTRVLAALLLAVPVFAAADDKPADKPKTGFVDRTFKNADGSTSPYVVFVPHGYDGTKEYPVILFLHGAGETKNPKAKKEGKMPAEVGIGPAIKKREKDFPFVTVIPRAESFGWGAESANAKRALAMLDEVMKEYKIDAKRQYLTGLSMGGMGTWSIALAHPDRFAAIVPICGRGDAKQAEKIKDLPCWAFHGDADTSVPVSGSRDMIEAIKKAGGTPKYTEYPKVGHNSWDPAYAEKELFPWLLEQKKK